MLNPSLTFRFGISMQRNIRKLFWDCSLATSRQLTPDKRGAILKNAPPSLDRLNLSPELWLHAVEHFGKRRAANRITAASRFNATASPALQPKAVPQAAGRLKNVDNLARKR
jgi:hypothetical protein